MTNPRTTPVTLICREQDKSEGKAVLESHFGWEWSVFPPLPRIMQILRVCFTPQTLCTSLLQQREGRMQSKHSHLRTGMCLGSLLETQD